MTGPDALGLLASAWTSAGNVSPRQVPAVSAVPIADRVAAVARAGYCAMGLVSDDLMAIRDTIGLHRLKEILADADGLRIEIEVLPRWWVPRGTVGDTYDLREFLFEAAAVLEPTLLKLASDDVGPLPEPHVLVPALREIADQAAEHGTRVAIEPMPFTVIGTVPLGADVIAAAAHPEAGLVVDAWHVFRAGTTVEELDAALVDGTVFGVELCDAAPEVRGTLLDDTIDRRLPCGHGCFDLAGLVNTLRSKGFNGPWGVEILSEDFRALPVADGLDIAADSARRLLRAVWNAA